MKLKLQRYGIIAVLLVLGGWKISAASNYLCEIGPIGGLSYYIGDANTLMFRNIQPTYGLLFRYKFTPRWALTTKGQYSNVLFELEPGTWEKSMLGQVDVVAEYNFFSLRLGGYERFSHNYSPYLFAGIGVALHGKGQHFGPYLPFGLGFKWQMAPRWGLTVEWQQQLFFCDNVEGYDIFDNTFGLNGMNFMKNDLVSTLTVGISFHFVREPKNCKMCER